MQKYKLRKEPLFEISILEDSFQFKDESINADTGLFDFSKIDSLRLGKRVNWSVSSMSFIVELAQRVILKINSRILDKNQTTQDTTPAKTYNISHHRYPRRLGLIAKV